MKPDFSYSQVSIKRAARLIETWEYLVVETVEAAVV